MELNTFTLDSLDGKPNPSFTWIEKKVRENLQPVIAKYVEDCGENNIEVSSAQGLLFWLVFEILTNESLYYAWRKKNEKKDNIS